MYQVSQEEIVKKQISMIFHMIITNNRAITFPDKVQQTIMVNNELTRYKKQLTIRKKSGKHFQLKYKIWINWFKLKRKDLKWNILKKLLLNNNKNDKSIVNKFNTETPKSFKRC